MKHILCFLGLMLTLNFNALATESATVDYDLQPTEEVTLEEVKAITLYRTEYVDSTCTRQEPYQDTQCGYETRYRNECHWVPGRNVCRTETDRQCRDVRRTRRECKPGRTRRECVNEPARRVCRTRNGVERCTNVPGRQRCRDVSGPQVCRNVPYTDRECSNVNRRVCDWVPARNECNSVPYQEYICRDVTRYRTVSYACKKPVQVPYQVDKKFSHTVSFEFTDKDQLGKAEINLSLNSSGNLVINYNNLRTETTYMQLMHKASEVVLDNDSEKQTRETVKINFGNLKKLLKPMQATQKSLWMNKAGDFKLKLDKTNPLKKARIQIKVRKESNNDIHFNREFKFEDFTVSDKELSIELERFGFDQLRGFLGKGVKLEVDVTVKLDMPANLIHSIPQKLEKNKRFNIKVYKNKDL
ncbi:putative exported protein [Halobacteriovorax marinus SJ]|uniref:Exported protein n=1 Tax=Halobacteriovorax marinus (strain ATCC BAA-682 / DSM 15412 / SJ) TaxID=862908 RepID=E1X095_HALMS|nr:hypothetical protein [Halobacteriovorax marinus]CBW26323.1 putative exported protein [Halobacteriovorax marinus SJ]